MPTGPLKAAELFRPSIEHHCRRSSHLSRRSDIPDHSAAGEGHCAGERGGDCRGHAVPLGKNENPGGALRAVPLGAILSRRLDVKGRRVGIIVFRGNVDLDRLPWIPKS